MREIVKSIMYHWKVNLLIRHIITDALKIGFLFLLFFNLNSLVLKLGVDFATLITGLTAFLYSILISFAFIYRKEEKPVEVFSVFIIFMCSSIIIKYFNLQINSDIIVLTLTFIVLNVYLLWQIVNKRPVFLSFFYYFSFTIFFIFIYICLLKIYPALVLAFFIVYLLIAILPVSLLKVFVIEFSPNKILGYSMLYAKIPVNAFNKLFRKFLNKPYLYIKNFKFKKYSDFHYFYNIVINDFRIIDGTLIYEWNFFKPYIEIKNFKIEPPLGGYIKWVDLEDKNLQKSFIFLKESIYYIDKNKVIDLIKGKIYNINDPTLFPEERGQHISISHTWGNRFLSMFYGKDLNLMLIIKKEVNDQSIKTYFVISEKQFDIYTPGILTYFVCEKLRDFLIEEMGVQSNHIWFVRNRSDEDALLYLNQLPMYILGFGKVTINKSEIDYINSILSDQYDNLLTFYEEHLKNINTILMVISTIIMIITLPLFPFKIF